MLYYCDTNINVWEIGKGSLKWNSGSIQEERGDTTYQARVE